MSSRVFKFSVKPFAVVGLLGCAFLVSAKATVANAATLTQEDTANTYSSETEQNEQSDLNDFDAADNDSNNDFNGVANPTQWRRPHPGFQPPTVVYPPNAQPYPPRAYPVPQPVYPQPVYPNPNYGNPNYGRPHWPRPGYGQQRPQICYAQNLRGMVFTGYSPQQAINNCYAAGSRSCSVIACQ